MRHLIDLHHLGQPRLIGVYLLLPEEPTLVDCGPASSFEGLERGLAECGLTVGDLRHLALTHIHLDHAGAAGMLVQRNPRLLVHVSAVGAPHLVDPSRLEASARRLFGDDFDRLWGELVPVPESNLRVAVRHAAGLDVLITPGHARHQVAYLDADGSCYPGDTAGVRIVPSTALLPATPPPEVDLQAWDESLTAIRRWRAERLCLPHFGVVEDASSHLELMRERLSTWAERVRTGATLAEFEAQVKQELLDECAAADVAAYDRAALVRDSYAGLRRYWEKAGVFE